MLIVKDPQDLVNHLRKQLAAAEKNRDDPSKRPFDKGFHMGEVCAYIQAIEIAESLIK